MCAILYVMKCIFCRTRTSFEDRQTGEFMCAECYGKAYPPAPHITQIHNTPQPLHFPNPLTPLRPITPVPPYYVGDPLGWLGQGIISTCETLPSFKSVSEWTGVFGTPMVGIDMGIDTLETLKPSTATEMKQMEHFHPATGHCPFGNDDCPIC